MNKFHEIKEAKEKKEKKAEQKVEPLKKPDDIVLLEEIRDLLKETKKD